MNIKQFEKTLKETKQDILQEYHEEKMLDFLTTMSRYQNYNLHNLLSIYAHENSDTVPLLNFSEAEKRFNIVLVEKENLETVATPKLDENRLSNFAQFILGLKDKSYTMLPSMIPLEFHETNSMFEKAKKDLEDFLYLSQLVLIEKLMRTDILENIVGFVPSKRLERCMIKTDYSKYFLDAQCYTKFFMYLTELKEEIFSFLENMRSLEEKEITKTVLEIKNPLLDNIYLKVNDKMIFLPQAILENQNFTMSLSESECYLPNQKEGVNFYELSSEEIEKFRKFLNEEIRQNNALLKPATFKVYRFEDVKIVAQNSVENAKKEQTNTVYKQYNEATTNHEGEQKDAIIQTPERTRDMGSNEQHYGSEEFGRYPKSDLGGTGQERDGDGISQFSNVRSDKGVFSNTVPRIGTTDDSSGILSNSEREGTGTREIPTRTSELEGSSPEGLGQLSVGSGEIDQTRNRTTEPHGSDILEGSGTTDVPQSNEYVGNVSSETNHTLSDVQEWGEGGTEDVERTHHKTNDDIDGHQRRKESILSDDVVNGKRDHESIVPQKDTPKTLENKEESEKSEASLLTSSVDKSEQVKNYLTQKNISLKVRVNEKDYQNPKLRAYFKDFEFTNGRTLESYNPFEESDHFSDLIRLEFFKNPDGEYRVFSIPSDSLEYHSNLNVFLNNLEKDIQNLENAFVLESGKVITQEMALNLFSEKDKEAFAKILNNANLEDSEKKRILTRKIETILVGAAQDSETLNRPDILSFIQEYVAKQLNEKEGIDLPYHEEKANIVEEFIVETEQKQKTLVEQVKETLVDFYNKEFGSQIKYEDFDAEFPNLQHIGLAYTTTEDENHEIQVELNLEDYTITQYVNDVPLSIVDYVKEYGSVHKALESIKFDLENTDFDTLVEVDEQKLRAVLGMEKDDNGNFYQESEQSLEKVADVYYEIEYIDSLPRFINVDSYEKYTGKKLTLELLDELRELDQRIFETKRFLGVTDQYYKDRDYDFGYSKLFLNQIENGQITGSVRIDLGDGKRVNQKNFNKLEDQIRLAQGFLKREEKTQTVQLDTDVYHLSDTAIKEKINKIDRILSEEPRVLSIALTRQGFLSKTIQDLCEDFTLSGYDSLAEVVRENQDSFTDYNGLLLCLNKNDEGKKIAFIQYTKYRIQENLQDFFAFVDKITQKSITVEEHNQEHSYENEDLVEEHERVYYENPFPERPTAQIDFDIEGQVEERKKEYEEQIGFDLQSSETDRERLSKDIDLALNNQLERYESIKIMDNTPDILKAIGMQDYPILISQNHIRNCLHEKGKNPHWHGLSKEDILNIPLHLENPTMIMSSFTNEKSIIIVTDTVDQDDLPIIISLKPDGEGTYKAETLDSNYITSIYGRSNFENFLTRNLESNNIIFAQKNKIQNLELCAKLQLLRAYPNDFEFDTIITQNLHPIKMIEKENIQNFVLTKEILAEKLTPSERLNYNLEAISILKRLEKGTRKLDVTAQEVLAKYVGWGGLAEAFDEEKGGQWEPVRNFLKQHLSESEYEAAKESTLTAFYTPPVVIDAMYQALSDMGFEGGKILEPSMGVGHFVGCLPEKMQNSQVQGVELDAISGKIAQYLYPQANIQIQGFEKTRFKNDFFDLTIGNVPFGEFKINDNTYDKNFLIHDYFFVKAIDQTRVGGVIAFITSNGTMDKKDESVRRYISQRCEFLGAVRLPNTTFKGVAGTTVTSDIIFLKKKTEGSLDYRQEWESLAQNEEGYTYNQYFVNHPEMVLGEMKLVSGRFGETLTCEPQFNSNVSFEEQLKGAMQKISSSIKEKIFEKPEHALKEQDEQVTKKIEMLEKEVEPFTYTVLNGEVYYKENLDLVKQNLSLKDTNKIIAYVKISETLRELIEQQKNNASNEEIKLAQGRLHEVYDQFAMQYQYINAKENKLLEEDRFFPLVSSIEVLDDDNAFVKKGDIFYQRTIQQAQAIDKVNTSQEALILSISQKGFVDFDYMEKLTGFSKTILLEELKGEIFLNLDSVKNNHKPDLTYLPFKNHQKEGLMYVPKDEYLSGNVREKFNVIVEAIDKINRSLRFSKENGDINGNFKEIYQNQLGELEQLKFQREELKQVLPKALKTHEIDIKLGATWIPQEIIENFMRETLAYNYSTKIYFSEPTSTWNIEGKSEEKFNFKVQEKYGTKRVNAYHLLEDTLNLRDTKVYDQVIEDGKQKSVLNPQETLLANQKQELLKEAFKTWVFENKSAQERLTFIYNEKFNSIRNRVYDGTHLALEGINPTIELRSHQKDAIARTLHGGNSLLAHVVGAGKTFAMVASIMEAKRLGLCTKALMVVPNHLTGQVGREFMQLYPFANIMVVDKEDFEKNRRKRFMSKIAVGNYDAVIIGHSQFEKLAMSKDYLIQYLKKQEDQILEYIAQKRYDRDERFSVKEMQKARKKIRTRLEKLYDETEKDDVIPFESLGVDKLVIDEAHYFKNLFFHTKLTNVSGINQREAARAADLFMKCRYIDELTDGKGIIFATGTPVSNTMVELYTMQRYLQYNRLEKENLINFDAWASTFGEVQTNLELTPEGNGYQLKSRFAKFSNLPELMNLFREIADIQTKDMLNLPTPEVKYETFKTQPSEHQKEILQNLAERASRIRGKSVDPKQDNMLKITTDGKKLALDQRLMNPLLSDDPHSKVNVCIKNVFRVWEETKPNSSTQLIFLDSSTPDNKEFNLYKDIKTKLIQLGVPPEEIAFIHSAKKDEDKEKLFSQVRKGEVRVLLGSTQKMGAGTNVQNKLIAIHDLDVPWRPADLEQRSGRIIRQGNENPEVQVYRYITENTFDAYLWGILENKQRFISQIMSSKTPVRTTEDVDETTLSYAEVKALATGNIHIKEKMTLENEITRLRILKNEHQENIYSLEKKIQQTYPQKLLEYEQQIQAIKEDIKRVEPQGIGESKFTSIHLQGEQISDRKLAGAKLLESIKRVGFNESKIIGRYRNMDIEVAYNLFTNQFNFSLNGAMKHYGEFGSSAEGNIQRMDNVLAYLDEKLQHFESEFVAMKNQLENAKREITKPFSREEELQAKILRLVEVNALLEEPQEQAQVPEQEEQTEFEEENIMDVNDEMNQVLEEGENIDTLESQEMNRQEVVPLKEQNLSTPLSEKEKTIKSISKRMDREER